MKPGRLALLAALALAPSISRASTVDDQSIIRYCGRPVSESQSQSPATTDWQRDLYYPDDVVLHFQPVDGGWTLSSAWVHHQPFSREALARRFPCVQAALSEADATPTPAIDPTIASQIGEHTLDNGRTQIPFFWLILVLIVIGLPLALLIPGARRRAKKRTYPTPRAPQRKPEVVVQAERESSGKIHIVE